MLKNYFLVEKSALPEFFIKVVETRRLLETGVYRQVSEAVRHTGISRSPYYKYKDRIMEVSESAAGRKAVLMLTLDHEAGILSRVLNLLSTHNANILTITQSLPIHGKANIMLSLDLSQIRRGIDQMTAELSAIEGVENVRLLALE